MFARVRLVQNSNPIYIKNLPVSSQLVPLKELVDVQMDNPINNSVLIYNQSDEDFHLDQLSLDGGNF